jgi:hypothetical protein
MTTMNADRDRLERALESRLPKLIDEVREGLRNGWPDYADFLGSDGDGVAEAARLFLSRLVTIPSSDTSAPEVGEDQTLQLVFEQIGRRRLQAGDELPRLLTAFQLGGRLAWRHVAAAALELELPQDVLAALADAVFVFVNRLSFAAARGYLKEHAEDAVARGRAREELAALLLSDRASAANVRFAAARAGWPIPDTAALVLVDPDLEPTVARTVDRLDPEYLPVRQEGLRGVIVPNVDSRGQRTRLIAQVRGLGAVIGHSTSPLQLPETVESARLALRLRVSGVIQDDPVVVAEHLDTLVVWRDPSLMEALRRQALAPLDELSPPARDRLTKTLASWLRHLGDRHAMADELAIHPQTVRYRMGQLHGLFGDALDSPRSRARLFLALQWTPDALGQSAVLRPDGVDGAGGLGGVGAIGS